jgi:hypothetical protein
MGPPGTPTQEPPTTVTLNNQGLIDSLQAAVTGLQPNATYQLALVQDRENPYQDFQPLTIFKTNPAGAQIVNTFGPLRHVVAEPGSQGQNDRRYLVIVPVDGSNQPKPVQFQLE